MNVLNYKIKYLAFFTGATLLLAVANTGAAIMTFTDTVDPSPDQLISFGNNKSYSFTHSIVIDQDGAGTFWSGIYGYNSLTDIISGASIELRFMDESNDIAPESVQLLFDAQSFGSQTITSGGMIYFATISNGWNALLNDGVLNVTLQNAGITNGQQDFRSDFLFLDSTLTVDVDRRVQAQQISEPASIPLLLLGVAALVSSRSKLFYAQAYSE